MGGAIIVEPLEGRRIRMGIGTGEAIVVFLVAVGIALGLVIPAMLICRRVGFHPLLGLAAAIPLVNVLLLWFVAVAPWPVERRRETTS
jgi:hypothetical protein